MIWSLDCLDITSEVVWRLDSASLVRDETLKMTLVERGRVLFTIGGEQRVAKAGDVLHFPSGTWHGATMLDEEVILVDIFSPIREDFLT